MNPVGAVKINGCVCMIRPDDYPTHELNGVKYRCGRVSPFGASLIGSGAECGPELITRIEGSSDLYGSRSAEASINFITCHDGFTLYDLVSYGGDRYD